MKKRIIRFLSVMLTAIILVGAQPIGAMNLSVKSKAKDLSSYKTGDIIEFGSYPQSKVTDSTLIYRIKEAGEESQWVDYNYYAGTGDFMDGEMKPVKNMMLYKDVEYDGNYYRVVKINHNRPDRTGYRYPDNNFQACNGYNASYTYCFKYEPLKWRVLDPCEGYVMCNSIIDSQPYQNFVYDNGDGLCYNSKDCENYAMDWATSSLRQWLNDDFYNTAFSEEEKAQIGISNLENKSPDNSKYDGKNTKDKIFPLSEPDTLNSAYGFKRSGYDDARKLKSTDYARCQGEAGSSWRVRTSSAGFFAAIVYDTGYVNPKGTTCFETNTGIAPAFKFNPKTIYSETFYLNYSDKTGSGVKYKSYDVKFDDPLVIPDDPVREGYSFKGWCDYDTRRKYGFVDLNNEIMDSTDGRSFYADWEANKYNSYFYSDGELFKTIANTCGNEFITPQTPQKDGYTFIGWTPEVPKITPAGDMRFDAVFEANKYIATLVVDGKVYKEIEYTYGQESIDLPDVPKKDGYKGEWESYSLGIGGVTINAKYTELPKVISVSVKDISLNYKKTATIKPTVKAENGAKYKISYSSSDPKVVTVDKNGKIYAAKRGSATITCTVTDSSGKTVTDTCKVTVKYTVEQWLIKILLFGWIWY